jgi:ribosome-binding factor A
VSADLSVAKVYVSIFPVGNIKVENVFGALSQNKKFLRNELAQKVRHQLRIIPELSFFIDDSLDYAENIDRLLK